MPNTQSLSSLLQCLRPVLHHGVYVFATLPSAADVSSLSPIATFREAEGLTVIVEESIALEATLEGQSKILFRAAWITLEVHSDLAAIGLTAAVSSALAAEKIACNIIAAAFHDHLFVPVEQGSRALEALRALSNHAKN